MLCDNETLPELRTFGILTQSMAFFVTHTIYLHNLVVNYVYCLRGKTESQHVQRSLNLSCYRQQPISLPEMIKLVCIFKLIHNLLSLMGIFTEYLAITNSTKTPYFGKIITACMSKHVSPYPA